MLTDASLTLAELKENKSLLKTRWNQMLARQLHYCTTFKFSRSAGVISMWKSGVGGIRSVDTEKASKGFGC